MNLTLQNAKPRRQEKQRDGTTRVGLLVFSGIAQLVRSVFSTRRNKTKDEITRQLLTRYPYMPTKDRDVIVYLCSPDQHSVNPKISVTKAVRFYLSLLAISKGIPVMAAKSIEESVDKVIESWQRDPSENIERNDE